MRGRQLLLAVPLVVVAISLIKPAQAVTEKSITDCGWSYSQCLTRPQTDPGWKVNCYIRAGRVDTCQRLCNTMQGYEGLCPGYCSSKFERVHELLLLHASYKISVIIHSIVVTSLTIYSKDGLGAPR